MKEKQPVANLHKRGAGGVRSLRVFTGVHMVDSDREAVCSFEGLRLESLGGEETELLTHRWYQDRRPRAMKLCPSMFADGVKERPL